MNVLTGLNERLPKGHSWKESDELKMFYGDIDHQFELPVWICLECKTHLSITSTAADLAMKFCYRNHNEWISDKIPTCEECKMDEALT